MRGPREADLDGASARWSPRTPLGAHDRGSSVNRASTCSELNLRSTRHRGLTHGPRKSQSRPDEVLSLRYPRASAASLKIFLGYAPGVGKTFSMLAEAHRRASRGEDIVIGFVETHGRQETGRARRGLERCPLKHLIHRGKEFEELDTAAVIARRPEWVLVDELAHTNVPGARARQALAERRGDPGGRHQRHHHGQHPALREPQRHRVTRSPASASRRPCRTPSSTRQTRSSSSTSRPPRSSTACGAAWCTTSTRSPARWPTSSSARTWSPCASSLCARPPRRSTSTSSGSPPARNRCTPGPPKSGSSSASAPAPWPPSSSAEATGSPSASRAGSGSCTYVRTRNSADRPQAGRAALRARAGAGRERPSRSKATRWPRRSCASLGDHRVTYIVLGQSRRSRIDEIVRGSRIAHIMREIDHADVLVVADPSKSPPVPSQGLTRTACGATTGVIAGVRKPTRRRVFMHSLCLPARLTAS